MWLSVISAVCCFAIAVILFTPQLRRFIFYQPMAVFFLFEGLWSLVNGFTKIMGIYGEYMLWIQYIAIVILFCFAFYMTFTSYSKNKKENSKLGVADAEYKIVSDSGEISVAKDDATDKQQDTKKNKDKNRGL